MSSDENKIEHQPEYDALYAFDQEHDVEPASVIAERIAAKYGFKATHPIVDDIHYAIEDAMELGQLRGQVMPQRSSDSTAQAVAWRVDGSRNGKPQIWFYYKPEWPVMHEEQGDKVTPLYATPVSSTHSNTVAEPSRCKNPVARGESKEADASTGGAPVASASTLSVTSTEQYDPAFVAELKRAEAAPPEATFSNAKEMLDYLDDRAPTTGNPHD